MRRILAASASMVLSFVAGVLALNAPAQERQARAAETRTLNSEVKQRTELPPLPAGVSELKFGDFFIHPVGPRGLEFSEKLRSLDGKRVRIPGYMVRQEDAPPGRLLLTPRPMQLHDDEYGLCDDLPSSTLYVSIRERRGEVVPYTPGLLLLTGLLSAGNREEPDGRISTVRLLLDRAPATKRKQPVPRKGAEALMSLGEARSR